MKQIERESFSGCGANRSVSMIAGIRKGIVVAMIGLTLGACATPVDTTSRLGSVTVTPEMLLEASPLESGPEPANLAEIDILEVTPAMRTFLDDHVRGRRDQSERLRLLTFAVMGEGTFRLVYDETTRTAAETFADQRGNCLSFTNLFVAMARYLGLEAHYQEVDVPPDWSLSGQSFLLSKHVNVSLNVSHEELIVDFNLYDFKMDFDHKVISDRRGRAHYFNNVGVEHLLAGDSALAFAYFRQSLREDYSFGPAWTNLGILHRREGYPDYAEAAYLQALRIDRVNLVAMSNLANLYEEAGLLELATDYQEQVQAHRMLNPYYRYQLAQAAVIDGDYAAAISHLEHAISQRKDEDRFYFLMSVSYLMNGDREEAQRWLEKAEAVAGEQRYIRKLDLLMGVDSSP